MKPLSKQAILAMNTAQAEINSEILKDVRFNLYSTVNYYGTLIFGIATPAAMPARFKEVIFTGSIDECKERILKLTNVRS